MQVQPASWKISPSKLKSVEYSIKVGTEILTKLKERSGGSIIAALHKYNLGATAYARGDRNPRYIARFEERIKYFKSES